MTLFYIFLKTAEVSLKTLIPQNLWVEKYNLLLRFLHFLHNRGVL
jgi:hypothetical protein